MVVVAVVVVLVVVVVVVVVHLPELCLRRSMALMEVWVFGMKGGYLIGERDVIPMG